MSELPDFDPSPPDRGSVGTIRSIASSFSTADGESTTAKTRVTAAGSQLGGSTSNATSAVTAKLGALSTQYATLASSSETAASALRTYANGLEQLQTRASQLRSTGQSMYGRIQSLRHQALNTVWDQLIGVFVPWDGVPWQVLGTHSPALGRAWQDAIDSYKTAASQYNALWSDRRTIDSRLMSALGDLEIARELGISRTSTVTYSAVLARSRAWAGDYGSIDIGDLSALGDPGLVFEVWNQLTPEQRQALTTQHPETIGNMQGIPYAVRDVANRLVLTQLLRDTSLSDATHDKLDTLKRSLDSVSGSSLISLELEGEEPRAAVAVGDLDTADSVSYMVHGINTDTSDIGPWVSAAGEFRRAVSSTGVTSSTAFVAWFRYDSGNIVTVSSDKLASAGASKLNSDLEGLAAVNPGAERILIGYSYGTTLVGQAMTTHSEYVDGVHLNGSAGLTKAAQTALESGVKNDEYFVTATEATKDTIARGGRNWFSSHRENPTEFEGITTISSEGGYVGDTYGQQVDSHDAHSGPRLEEVDMIANLGDTDFLAHRIAELESRGIEYQIGTTIVGGHAYTALYTTATGYFSPDSQPFLETVQVYKNRLD